jgi:hypothetical protein
MKTVSIVVDVWCQYNGECPVYRIYVDNDLLTERTFIWNTDTQFIREHIEVNLMPGEHWVTVEHTAGDAKFRIENVQVDGVPVASLTEGIEAKFLI